VLTGYDGLELVVCCNAKKNRARSSNLISKFVGAIGRILIPTFAWVGAYSFDDYTAQL
jgi:hypothetical protein